MNEKRELSAEEVERITTRLLEKLGVDDVSDLRASQLWVAEKMKREQEMANSTRRVTEKIVGTIGAAGVIAVVTWFGSVIIDQAAHLIGKVGGS